MYRKVKKQILSLRGEGHSYSEIQRIVGCSKATISFHCGLGQKEKNVTRSQARRAEARAWIAEYKSTRSCIRCGFNNPLALDFHHRDPSEKEWNISEMIDWYKSPSAFAEEVAKCDLVCSNCHRILHNSGV